MVGFGDVVLHEDMIALKQNYMTHIFVFQKTDKELRTTASHNAVFSERPNYVGDRHCQEGQNAWVYKLHRNVMFSCGTVGGKRRRKRYTKRKYKNRRRNTRRRK